MKQHNKYLKRKDDWRNGAVIYQVLLDRFAPSQDDKSHIITHPRKMRAWDEKPSRGIFLEQHHYWTHELDFLGWRFKKSYKQNRLS